MSQTISTRTITMSHNGIYICRKIIKLTSYILTSLGLAFCFIINTFLGRHYISLLFLPSIYLVQRSIRMPESLSERWVRFLTFSVIAMDHLHYRLNFDLDKNFITAWKSITKLVIFQSFVAKCCKMRII
jgi:hypothetical protein